MITIKDVARAAGVSPSTVSRVLNDNRAISMETKKRVRAAVKDLGFVPNALARSLAGQSTCTVALVINIENSRAYANPFFSEVLHGIETVVYSEGYFLIIANEKTIAHQRITLDRLVQEKRIDGLILPSAVLTKSLVQKLEREGFPFVVIGEPDIGGIPVDFVDVNNRLGGEQAVGHLLDSGYRRVAYMGGLRSERFNHNRLQGYREGLRRGGVPVLDALIVEEQGQITKESGMRLGMQLLSLREPPDAILCTDNILAWGAIKAARESGRAIPRDLGIVSFDNFPLAEFVEPSLTTVDIDVFTLGAQAARRLMQNLRAGGQPRQQSLIAPMLIVRDSTMREGQGDAH